jgi:hydrogenase nickel incorporation protein HypB
MCESCGCALGSTPESLTGGDHSHPFVRAAVPREQVTVWSDLMAQNDRTARHNREHLDAHGVLAINLMSAPGAGKTSLLEATIERLRDRYRICVIEGDLATENDARRIRARGVPAVQITTGSACHLDASMLHRALHQVRLDAVDLLFIENVGNLVCPASFDLGQHCSVALLSVPEGDDKPQKYPVMFRSVDLVLFTKTDLLEHIPEFDLQRARSSLHSIACAAPVVELSSRRGAGLDGWCEWLDLQKAACPRRTRAAALARTQRSDFPASVHAGSNVQPPRSAP